MNQNRITLTVPTTRGHSTTIKPMDFKVVDQDGDAIVEGEVFLQMVNGRDEIVLMSQETADELLRVYVEKMGITPEMVQEFIDVTKAKMEIMLTDAGICVNVDQAEKDDNLRTGGLYGPNTVNLEFDPKAS